MKTFYLSLLLFAGLFLGKSQQLVYKPVNPNFGGDSYNYSWLLGSANAQNQFDNKSGSSGYSAASSMSSFTESLNRQVLSQLSSKLFQNSFGENGVEAGNYVFGSLYVQVTNTSNGTMISILDTNTGEQSEVVIPK
ncbi:MAG: curli assembly protein CsgF [Chryseobacterium sp.]|nr:curli assembly protein CsgF [Candidatus Chryseobacterium enterohippi]